MKKQKHILIKPLGFGNKKEVHESLERNSSCRLEHVEIDLDDEVPMSWLNRINPFKDFVLNEGERSEVVEKLVEKGEGDLTFFKLGDVKEYGELAMQLWLLKNQRLLRRLDAVDLPLTPSLFRESFVFFVSFFPILLFFFFAQL